MPQQSQGQPLSLSLFLQVHFAREFGDSQLLFSQRDHECLFPIIYNTSMGISRTNPSINSQRFCLPSPGFLLFFITFVLSCFGAFGIFASKLQPSSSLDLLDDALLISRITLFRIILSVWYLFYNMYLVCSHAPDCTWFIIVWRGLGYGIWILRFRPEPGLTLGLGLGLVGSDSYSTNLGPNLLNHWSEPPN